MKGAAQRWFVASMLATLLVVPAGSASGADATDADRTYRNYTRETATVADGQVRVEIRGMEQEDQDNVRLNLAGLRLRRVYPGLSVSDLKNGSVSGGVIDLVGSYGVAKDIEAGFIVPGYIQKVSFGNGMRVSDQDIGDLLLYGKFQRSVAEHCAVGAGVELTMPNGPKDKGFGTGEFGAAPVVSTRYQHGPWAVGANVGYQIYAGTPSDVFNYGLEIILRGSELYAFRTELAGRVFNEDGTRFNDLAILPGIDYNLSNNVTIRPQGMIGGTDFALDWGIGVGAAMTF